MKIISEKKWGIEKTCGMCTSVLFVEAHDIKFRSWTDISQCREQEFYFTCPMCGNEGTVDEWEIPKSTSGAARDLFNRNR